MTVFDFFIVWLCCLVTMLACRCLPIFVLKGRQLSENTQAALNLIPPAAFAALVANDLFTPGMMTASLWPDALPLVATLVVVVVARVSKSLLWCAVAGVLVYALLTLI